MQTIRGTKDILPNEVEAWQELYIKALEIFKTYNYHEIRTPIMENTDVFLKSVGSSTDIVSKEMYRFIDKGQRDITLRPEGTACIARAVASNKLHSIKPIQKLWYMGPMFRYERPQYGRQRQFHQLGLECIGSDNPMADVEVINIAHTTLQQMKCPNYTVEINSLGNLEERNAYKTEFKSYMENYKNDLDSDSKKRLQSNPLRILDSKNIKTQEIIEKAPSINRYLGHKSQKHLDTVCEYLSVLRIPYALNNKLVRGLDYYSHTAFEILCEQLDGQKTICGGGRYNDLVKQFGGPDLPGVGWAIGVERLLLLTENNKKACSEYGRFEIITEGLEADKKSWNLIEVLSRNSIMFNLNLSKQHISKKIKKAAQSNSTGCLIIGNYEIENSTITVKWLEENLQETVKYDHIAQYLKYKLKSHNSK